MYYELNHLVQMASGEHKSERFRILCQFCGTEICSDVPISFKKANREYIGMCGCPESEEYMRKFNSSASPLNQDKELRAKYLIDHIKYKYMKPSKYLPFGIVVSI